MPVSSLGITQVRALGRARNPELALHWVLLKYNFQVLFLIPDRFTSKRWIL